MYGVFETPPLCAKKKRLAYGGACLGVIHVRAAVEPSNLEKFQCADWLVLVSDCRPSEASLLRGVNRQVSSRPVSVCALCMIALCVQVQQPSTVLRNMTYGRVPRNGLHEMSWLVSTQHKD
jgi:hypothetical protein